MSGALFGVIPIGQAIMTAPSSAISETSLLYAVNNCESVVVSLIPGASLPAQTAAAIYVTSTSDFTLASATGQTPDFKLSGAVGPGKESVFIDIKPYLSTEGAVIGISIEAADEVAGKMQQMPLLKSKPGRETTISLAQAIISNAFDFMASFSGMSGPDGVEVVPLKAFENWWKKFESRVRSDPSFLER
ncbi:hypothetical protein Cpir12675_001665 [Ceratocystis pirilliformis]|uniref:Protein OPI10 n=1 Tax=Ceratocystis pirilliformis TaxID=259994 RepID=A0ABR3ZEA8_9PEZI